MNKNKIFLLLFTFTLIHSQVFGQTFKQQFYELSVEENVLVQEQFLENWKKIDPNDPELYVAYFNYYVKKSINEVVRIDNNPNNRDGFHVENEGGETVGVIYSDTHYDVDLLDKAFHYIDIGIEKYPNRLDMRFGKIYVLGEDRDYEKFTSEIINVIEYSAVNKNQWFWTDNQLLENPKETMFDAIQDYQILLYNTEKDDLLENMKQIAEAVLKYYPDDVRSLSNLSIVFMLQNEYDKALDSLLKAEKLTPDDFTVLGNIAQAYKLKNDIKKAVKYYELMFKYGDEEVKQYAKQQIEELNQK